MLEKLATARKKALLVKKQLKEQGDEAKVKFHQEKVDKKQKKLKKGETLLTPSKEVDSRGQRGDPLENSQRKEATKDPIEEPLEKEVEGQSGAPLKDIKEIKDDCLPPPIKRSLPISSPTVVYESESDVEDQVIYIKKSKRKPKKKAIKRSESASEEAEKEQVLGKPILTLGRPPEWKTNPYYTHRGSGYAYR